MLQHYAVFNDHLNRIRDTKGSKAKQEAMALAFNEEMFEVLVRYVCDPFITYGVKEPLVLDSPPPELGFFDVLERMAKRELTGSDARIACGHLINLGVPYELMIRILHKDLKCGIEDVNKIRPGLIPDFPYMRCSLPAKSKLADFDWELGVYVDEKADGQFLNLNYEHSGLMSMVTRQGQQLPVERFESLISQARDCLKRDTQTHGELLVRVDGVVQPRQISNGILNRIQKGGDFEANEQPVYFAWDQIPLDCVTAKGRCETSYVMRRTALESQLVVGGGSIRMIRSWVVYSRDDMFDKIRLLLSEGKEGGVAKDPHGPWFDGTSKYQVKIKPEFVVDLKIVGKADGDKHGKHAGKFGSLICRTSDDLLEVKVSGIKDRDRDEMHAMGDALFDCIAVVKANDLLETPGKLASLFLPRFIERRTDKREADSLQRVREQLEAARSA